MAGDSDSSLARNFPEALKKIRERTPARIFVGRAGAAYRTATQIELREANAAARDAVRDELDMESAFGPEFVRRWDLFEVCTEARTKEEYLLQPDQGRRLSEASRRELASRCSRGNDILFAVGDGLSVTAVSVQVPQLLPLVQDGARARGWSVGHPFVIRHCRVGILNEIGATLAPKVAVLLIGERPGLATAESLSAYMAYRPLPSQTDADRNLISSIHSRGIRPEAAATRILNLAAQMMGEGISGYRLREESLGAEIGIKEIPPVNKSLRA